MKKILVIEDEAAINDLIMLQFLFLMGRYLAVI